jgi:hypothetical protein
VSFVDDAAALLDDILIALLELRDDAIRSKNSSGKTTVITDQAFGGRAIEP